MRTAQRALAFFLALVMALGFCNFAYPMPVAIAEGGPMFTISGANTAELNGTYTPGVDYGGKALYFGPGGSPMLYWNNGRWELTYSYQCVYYSNSTANDPLPPTGGWLLANGSTDSNFSLSYGPTFSFSQSAVTANESAEVVNLTIALSEAFPTMSYVSYSTSNGTAQSADYGGGGSQIYINGGVTSYTLSISIEDDDIYEGNETFTVSLYGASAGAGVGTIGTCTVTIVSDDPQPTIGFGTNTASVNENEGTVTLAVGLSGPSGAAATVNYATSNGTAAAGSDYTAKSGTVTIPAGSTSANIQVTVTDDIVFEGNETFQVTLTGPGGATLGTSSATVTVVDNETQPTIGLSATTYSANEMISPASITVQLSGPSKTATTVDYATTDGSAEAGSDYLAASGTVTVAAGSTTATIQVLIVDDSTYEGNEAFTVTLSNPDGATLGTSTATVTITEDEMPPVIGFASTSINASESAAAIMITVSLSEPSDLETTASYTTMSGTATAGLDFTAQSGTVTIPAGSLSETIWITLDGDDIDEPSEYFDVMLTSFTNAMPGNTMTTITLADDDPTPAIGFSSPDGSVSESGGTITLTVALSGPSSSDVTVNYATANGAAAAGEDYEDSSGSVLISAGNLSTTVSIPISGDTVYEEDETFLVNLYGPSGAMLGTASATVTILDDETEPSVGLAAATASAGETVGTATFTVALSGLSATDVTVWYETNNGTASAGSDYTAKSGTLTIPAGQLSGTIAVTITDDAIHEGNETFSLALSDPAGATLGLSSATATISDNDPTPAVGFADTTISIGEGAEKATLTVELSGLSSADVTVQYDTADGSATVSQDYVAKSGVLTIPSGQLYGVIEIPLREDDVYESDEAFTVELSSPDGASLGATTTTVTIDDNEPLPSISFADATVTAAEGSGTVTLTVRLSGLSASAATVHYGTSNGTALSGTDYTAKSGTVTIPAGSLEATVTIALLDDSLNEPDKAFTVTLSDPAGASLGTSTATVTIANDDGLPQAGFDAAVVNVPEGNAAAEFTVVLTAPSGSDVTVQYATAAGTATAGRDFTQKSGTLTIPAGQLSAVIQVPLIDDNIYEGYESLHITLTAPVNATLGTDAAMAILIDSEAMPAASLSQASLTVSEADGSAQLTVRLSGKSASAVTVTYGTQDGSATAGKDYATANGSVVIPAGEVSGVITVGLLDDTAFEGEETFTVRLKSATNATLQGSTATVTIASDDPEPTPEPTATASPTLTPTASPILQPTQEPTATPTPAISPTPSTSATAAPVVTVAPEAVTVEQTAGPQSNGMTVATVDGGAIDDAVGQAVQAGQQAGTTLQLPDVQSGEGTGVSLVLPVAPVNAAGDAGMSLAVNLDDVSFHIPAKVLQQPDAASGGSTITLESRQVEGETAAGFAIGGGEGAQLSQPYSFNLIVTHADGSKEYLHEFDEKMMISVQLTEAQAAAIQNPENVKMCYIDAETGETEVMESRYDPATYVLTFWTSHFSVFTPMEILPIRKGMQWYWWVLIAATALGLMWMALMVLRKKAKN